MIVLHAGIRDGQLLLWGETPDGPAPRPPRRRARGSKPGRAARLPYDAGSAAMSAALAEVTPGLTIGKPRFTQAVVWLPTVAGEPVASSSLIAEPPTSRAEPTLAPWAVTVLPLSVEQTVTLLCDCVGKDTLAPGVIVGQDLAFWTNALRFAGELVARQQFLPSVSQENGEYRACWKPVLAGPERERLGSLAKAMPAAARALTLDAEAPPDAAAGRGPANFVDGIVDHLVRGTAALATGAPHAVPARSRRGRSASPPIFDSVHDQWLSALRAPDGALAGDAAELAHFAVQVREWQRPISVATTAPLRLCFRLDEPAAEAGAAGEERESARMRPGRGAWRVQYLLQAADDPSLLVPADEAWRARGHQAAVLRRPGFNAKEYLLRALGQASGLCPRIEASLKTPAPSGYELDATGAHEFLTEKAAALEQTGFGVLLPAWWTRKGTKLRLTARANVKSPKLQGGAGLTLDTVVQFNWEVALGGETLSLAELRVLANLKAPLVRLRGQWVQVSAAEIQAALDFWKAGGTGVPARQSGQATAREIVQMALGAARTAAPVPLDGVTADGWLGELLAQLDGRTQFGEVSVPERFQGTLRPYQVRGYSWLCFLRQWGLGACLADDMGLGKTPQTLALIQRDWQVGACASAAGDGRRPVLLVCPTSVVGNWQKEAARFTPDLPVLVHHGLTRTKGAAFKQQAEQHALVISSYALLHRDFEILKTVSWAGVVLDEAQNIKNTETKQAKAARGLATGVRIALTGTPVENNVGDLWSIMEFLNPGLLGTQAEFKRTFFIPIQAGRDPEAAQRLKRITGPFLLRRLKTDKSIIADLPDKLEMKVFCTLTKEQASLYAAVVKEAEAAIEGAEGIQRKGVILATLSKLKQVCNHPAQFLGDNSTIPGRSGKLARLTEMLEEVLAVGDRTLVFSQFSEMGELLRRHLQETFGREVLFLHGGVPKKQRDRMIERFQADGDNGHGDGPRIFILSLKAGGTGLNLTAANHVFHFDRWWNPAVENQATDRAFRIGQTRNVQVHKFLCAGTLEEKIDEMIERKKEVAETVVGTGESWLTELSTRQLKELFALRKEAIGD